MAIVLHGSEIFVPNARSRIFIVAVFTSFLKPMSRSEGVSTHSIDKSPVRAIVDLFLSARSFFRSFILSFFLLSPRIAPWNQEFCWKKRCFKGREEGRGERGERERRR